MKKMLSIIAVLLVSVLVISITACNTGNETETTLPQTTQSTPSTTGGSQEFYQVGISQLIQHEALDAATQGFKDALTEKIGRAHV